MAGTLRYLTVQDILWINLQVTKKVHHFRFARLEEATFYQNAYGNSTSLIPQAGRFVSGFVKMAPFDAGNLATAFVSCLAFLRMNGADVDVVDGEAATWFERMIEKTSIAVEALTKSSHCHDDDQHLPDVKMAVQSVLADYPCTIEDLVEENADSHADV